MQHDLFSLLVLKQDRRTLVVRWEDIRENYRIQLKEVEAIHKVIKNNSEHHKIGLLVEAYEGISFTKEALKFIQSKEHHENLSAIAVILKSSTQRLSLNLYANFNRSEIPVRGFMSKDYAQQWLRKKQLQLLKRK